MTDSAKKFDPARAAEYEQQSRIALAGYEAFHELTACLLAAALGSCGAARVLVVGRAELPRRLSPQQRPSDS
jgi:tRNA (cmo5U34)-methyltransferase